MEGLFRSDYGREEAVPEFGKERNPRIAITPFTHTRQSHWFGSLINTAYVVLELV